MGFSEFSGNTETVHRLREMLGQNRLAPSLILAGPRGSGKYTLAQMMAKAIFCEQPPMGALPDFCGSCPACLRIAEADDLESRCSEAVEAREALREADRRETRLLVQTHPDVLIIPPDPPQLMIKVDQVRRVTEMIYRRPSSGPRRLFVFTDSAFMKEAANALLKVLEEPPEFASIFLLTENPGELLTTMRSRCVTFALSPLPLDEVVQWLARRRPEWDTTQRWQAAALSGGALGSAYRFDVKAYGAARQDALVLLGAGAASGDHSVLFRTTEGYRAGADGREKTELLLRTIYSLLEDMMFLQSNAPELVRNRDIAPELQALAARTNFDWIAAATHRVNEVEAGMRRNVLRNVSLDAFSTSLEQ